MMMNKAFILTVFLLICITTISSGFVNTPLRDPTFCLRQSSSIHHAICRKRVVLFAEEDGSKESLPSDSIEVPKVEAAAAEEPAKYPINVPSPILLGASMVLAIASTGSLFELLGGDPLLGTVATTAVAVIGFPLCLFLFYASILKATAETEEDDKEFLGMK